MFICDGDEYNWETSKANGHLHAKVGTIISGHSSWA